MKTNQTLKGKKLIERENHIRSQGVQKQKMSVMNTNNTNEINIDTDDLKELEITGI